MQLIEINNKNSSSGNSGELNNPLKMKPGDINPAVICAFRISNKNSKRTFISNINKVSKMIAGLDYKELNWLVVDQYMTQRVLNEFYELKVSPSTTVSCFSAIKAIMTEAWNSELISLNDLEKIKQIKVSRGSRVHKDRVVNKNEVRLILSTLSDNRNIKSIRDKAIFLVLLTCGLRRSELIDLNFEDFWVDETTIKSRVKIIGKGNKERYCQIPKQTIPHLLEWLNAIKTINLTMKGSKRTDITLEQPDYLGSDFKIPLFVQLGKSGAAYANRLTDNGIYYLIRELYTKANVDSFSPHDLRGTYCTNLINTGLNILLVKEAMGHVNIATTEIYNRQSRDILYEACSDITF